MAKGNKFGIAPPDPAPPAPRRSKDVGPMGAAVREAASHLGSSSEALIEQRRQNAAEAKEYRAAQEAGRILREVPISQIATTDLPRDRMQLDEVLLSNEMEELKASIRARGQKDPIVIYPDGPGKYQLVNGWRRLSALQQLYAETGEDRFSHAIAKITSVDADRLDQYVDMVEENILREDLTFAEMAQVVIDASRDPRAGLDDPEALVGRLYASFHRTKRSYVRTFVSLLVILGPSVQWPKAIPRNLGLDVARRLKEDAEAVNELRRQLAVVPDADAQNALLTAFVQNPSSIGPARRGNTAREKLEFHSGGAKITARAGECRIKSKTDFMAVDRTVLEKAVAAFNAVIEKG